MEKGNCTVCGTTFPFRKGKMYCSDSCKTKAHGKRKAGEPITGEHMRPKGSTITFDIAEHEKVNELIKNFTLPLDVYCFFRKNLPSQITPEKIAGILNDYYQCNRFDGDDISVHASLQNSFVEFQKNFFAGAFEIIDSSLQAA